MIKNGRARARDVKNYGLLLVFCVINEELVSGEGMFFSFCRHFYVTYVALMSDCCSIFPRSRNWGSLFLRIEIGLLFLMNKQFFVTLNLL